MIFSKSNESVDAFLQPPSSSEYEYVVFFEILVQARVPIVVMLSSPQLALFIWWEKICQFNPPEILKVF